MDDRTVSTLVLLAALSAVTAHSAAPAVASDEARPFGLEARKPWTTSRLVGSPEPPLPYTVEPTFTNIEWKAPIYVIDEPGGDYLWTITQGDEAGRANRIARVADDPDTRDIVPLVDLPGRLVYAVCFDPDYATNRQVYVFSNGPDENSKKRNRVSRFVAEPGPPMRIDPGAEEVIVEWRSEGHDGGDLVFGLDGMLYVATGDGTGDSDTWNSGQSLDDLLGAILRIDVKQRDGDRPYAIPDDNPFVDLEGARGEVWAYGLRNPWRLALDAKSGRIWVGNNGQDLWETAHLVGRGENYGWSVFEGSHPFYLERQRGPTPLVPPTIEHSHAEFRSLTGGVVYYGDKLPDLEGAYIYGDYSTGRIWGMLHDGQRAVWHRELADTTLQLAAFRVDQRGELLVVDYTGGIYRLVPAPDKEPTGPFPTRLSETGLFASTAEHRVADGVIPYSVNAEGWNDGATVERFFALPGEQQIALPPDAQTKGASMGMWSWPERTALVQTLSLADVATESGKPRCVETRVLLLQDNEWTGYSYRWNDAQTDAELVPKEGADATFASAGNPSDDADNDAAGRAWRFASRAECMACHSRAANYVLGLNEAQVNRDHRYRDATDNQLRTLEHIGAFNRTLPKPPEELARLTNPYDEHADVEARARAYLHVNCSVCHVAAGGGNAQMVLSVGTARDAMKLLGARPQHNSFGLSNAMLVAPGDPDRSVLVHRLSRRGRGQMPPLVSRRVDGAAVELMRQWISQLPPEHEFVRKWTMEDLLPEVEGVTADRSIEAGKAAFQKTGCAQCHRFGDEGGTVGPDLSAVATRLKKRELLESILLPSKVIADQYASFAVATDDGKVVAGRIEREDDEAVVVRPNSAFDTLEQIPKRNIVGRRRLDVSNMPEGIFNVLQKHEVLDLVAFLLSGTHARGSGGQ